MTMKNKHLVIGIGGEPASGKSTVVESFFKDIDDWKGFKYKTMKGYYSKTHNLYLLGVYNGALFQGTDKLSMRVAGDLYTFVEKIEPARILFEGDRLFSKKVFETLEGLDCKTEKIILWTSKQAERIIERGSEQTEQFKKAKKTKVQNMIDADASIQVMGNNEPEDILHIKNELWRLLKKKIIE